METAAVNTKVKWSIDTSHSEIGFIVKQVMIAKIKGLFNDFGATVFTDGKSLMTSAIDFWIDPESIQTGDKNRDAHLRSTDFFDVSDHREITFIGKDFEKSGDDSRYYVLHGELNMKGITNPIKLDVEFAGEMQDTHGDHRIGFYIKGKLNRKDWNLNSNKFLDSVGLLTSDEIFIYCKFQLIQVE